MTDAFRWLADPAHWSGPDGILTRTAEHVGYSALTLLIAAAIALPVGLAIGHSGRGRDWVVPVTGAARALPTLGVLSLLSLKLGIGLAAPLIALVLLAIPPILAGAYAGLESVDRDTVLAARATGFTDRQLLWQVEIPLALPLILAGIRSASQQVVATWTVAAFLPVGGLGRFLIDGLATRNYAEMLGGSIIVVILALLVEGVLATASRLATPRGVRVLHQPIRSTIKD